MEINYINKELYELAFIQNGEFGYSKDNWKPSIDETQISELESNENGYFPATPLGYRDYKISRLQGLQNIFDQYPFLDLTDIHHDIKRSNNIIKLYDKVKINDSFYIVVGDNVDCYFVVDKENRVYSVKYLKE